MILVTGASLGVGKAMALSLARAGQGVVMVARDEGRLKAAAADVRAVAAGGAEVTHVAADLSRMADVRRLADAAPAKLTAVLNNAALVPHAKVVTPEGLDGCFATNVLAPFLLNRLLFDRLKASGGRVVNFFGGNAKQFFVDDLQSEKGSPSGFEIYGRSKVALAAMTLAQARKWEGTGVTVNGAFPGLVNTEGLRGMKGFWWVFTRLSRPFQKTPDEGAATGVWLATSAEVAGKTGTFYGSMTAKLFQAVLPLPAQAMDVAQQEAVYAACERLTA